MQWKTTLASAGGKTRASLALLVTVTVSGCTLQPHNEQTGAPQEGELPGYRVVNEFKPAGESNVRSSLTLDDNTVLIGTEETADAYKSTDGGLTWRKTFDAGDAYGAQDFRFFIRAADGSLFASTSGEGDILRSTDAGESWERINSIPAWRTVGLIQLADGTLLTGARKDESGETSIYRSTDGFETLERVGLENEVQQNVTVFHDLGGGVVLAGIGFDGTAKVYRSADSGRSWTRVADFEGTSDIFDFIEVDGTLYTSTKSTAKIYRSTDQGRTWREHTQLWERGFLGTFARLDWRGREYLLLAGTDQRNAGDFRHLLLISADSGETWKEWIELQRDNTGGASNVTVLGDHTIIVGTGNHSAQGRAFTIAIED